MLILEQSSPIVIIICRKQRRGEGAERRIQPVQVTAHSRTAEPEDVAKGMSGRQPQRDAELGCESVSLVGQFRPLGVTPQLDVIAGRVNFSVHYSSVLSFLESTSPEDVE
jgi:hypothetical protein